MAKARKLLAPLNMIPLWVAADGNCGHNVIAFFKLGKKAHRQVRNKLTKWLENPDQDWIDQVKL